MLTARDHDGVEVLDVRLAGGQFGGDLGAGLLAMVRRTGDRTDDGDGHPRRAEGLQRLEHLAPVEIVFDQERHPSLAHAVRHPSLRRAFYRKRTRHTAGVRAPYAR